MVCWNYSKIDIHLIKFSSLGDDWCVHVSFCVSKLEFRWRHQMETFSKLLALCEGNHWSLVDSPHKGQWQNFGIFFDLHLNKRLSKHSKCRWFEMPSCSLWRHGKEISQMWSYSLIHEYLSSLKKFSLKCNINCVHWGYVILVYIYAWQESMSR